jgi:membrane protein
MDHRFAAAERHIESLWGLGGLSWRELLQCVWNGINQNDLIDRAYELAFNFLLGAFPLLFILVIALGAFASEGSALRGDLFFYLRVMLPPDASQLVLNTLARITRNAGGEKLAFTLLFSWYSGSAGITQLMSTLNAAYEVRERRSWIKVRLISLCLTLAMAVLIIAALALLLLGGQVGYFITRFVGLNTPVYIAVKIVQWVLALGFVVFAFATIYRFAPDVPNQRWYWITPGSLVGVFLWALASAGLRVYLHYFDSYNATYGSLGAVVILMLWFYVAGLAMLVGSQINATIDHACIKRAQMNAQAPDQTAA